MKITKNEWSVLTLALNYDDRESQLSDNFSNCDMDMMKAMGWSEYKIGGVVSQLQQKELGHLEDKAETRMMAGGCPIRAKNQRFHLSEAGVNYLFDIYEQTGDWTYPDWDKLYKGQPPRPNQAARKEPTQEE